MPNALHNYLITWVDTDDSARIIRSDRIAVAPDWEPSPTTLADAPKILAVAHLGSNAEAHRVLIVTAILTTEV